MILHLIYKLSLLHHGAQLSSYDTDFVAQRTQILTIWPFVVKVVQHLVK